MDRLTAADSHRIAAFQVVPEESPRQRRSRVDAHDGLPPGAPLMSLPVVEDLVVANHILYDEHVFDGFGHVSARHPESPDRFLLARSLAPALVTADDLVVYDLSGEPEQPDARRPYIERFIHAEIYRARPDVQAVVHSHAPSIIPFTIGSVPLRPVYHMAGFLGVGVSRFDIRAATGRMTNLLVADAELGRALATALGHASVVLMRGHGMTVVGRSVKEAVFRAIYTEINARIYTHALALGGTVELLAEEEAALTAEATAANLDRPWELWKRAALARRRDSSSG